MNSTIVIGLGVAAFAALYYFYRPQQTAVIAAQPPLLPAAQDPRDANAFCKGVVSTAATAAATYYGGAAGGAAAQKTGASAGAGLGVCSAIKKAEDVQLTAANYVAGALPSAIGDPFRTATTSAIKSANPFTIAEHPVDSAKNALGAIKNVGSSVVNTIGGWFS